MNVKLRTPSTKIAPIALAIMLAISNQSAIAASSTQPVVDGNDIVLYNDTELVFDDQNVGSADYDNIFMAGGVGATPRVIFEHTGEYVLKSNFTDDGSWANGAAVYIDAKSGNTQLSGDASALGVSIFTLYGDAQLLITDEKT
jgi:hypothetical protein